MPKLVFIIIILIYHTIFAQDWQKFQVDSFYIGTDDKIVLLPHSNEFGISLHHRNSPDFPSRFWLKGDWWLPELYDDADAYFTFGKAFEDSLQLWAAGYSLSRKKVIFGELTFGESGKILYRELAQKPVEIIDRRRQYVFMITFLRETNEIKIEVNGVPMLVKSPTSYQGFNHFGYMVKGGKIRFQKMEIKGD